MVKYKLVIRPLNNLPNATPENNLINLNGYLVHNNSIVKKGDLVNEENVIQYLQNPQNANIVERFKKYIKEYVSNDAEFKAVYYNAKKVFPILNDYYNEEVRFNSEANPILIANALSETEQIFYTDNNFNLLTNKRMSYKNKTEVIEMLSANTVVQYRDYYIDVGINVRQDSLFGTDFSKYFQNTQENGITYKNAFVDLNQQTDPFAYWTNVKPTKVWQTSAPNPEEDRVQEFEDIASNLEKKANEIKDKNSIEYTVAARKAEVARKIADKKRVDLEKLKKIRKKINKTKK
tara:strand:+ start:1238 stop:2110 length:873 start_codon:yes stop_codon:yes gene_type:complete